jgi:hypothetical protein
VEAATAARAVRFSLSSSPRTLIGTNVAGFRALNLRDRTGCARSSSPKVKTRDFSAIDRAVADICTMRKRSGSPE